MTSRCRRIALWELNELEAALADLRWLAGPLPGAHAIGSARQAAVNAVGL